MLRATLQTVQASTASRRYATSALASPQIQVSQAGQGVRVATARSEASPAASVSLVVKAGSRYESADNAGVAHFLKNFAFKNTQNRTGFRIIRESELQGGILTASIDREHLVYTARCLQDDVPYFAGLLAAVAFETRYTAYEFVDLKAQVASETLAAQADSNIKLFDELHRVAFNRGLGNSLYASPYNQITHQKLCNYASQAFQGSQMSLVGVNVHHNQLADLANQLFAQAPATLALQGAPAQYVGGEALIDGPASQTQYVLAYPTAGRSDLKQAAAHQVLGHALGGPTQVKWGHGASPLAQVATKLGQGIQFQPFQLSYAESGLFGVRISAPNNGAKLEEAVSAAVVQVRKLAESGLQDADHKRAVSQAKSTLAMASETTEGQLALLSSMVFQSGPASMTTQELVATYDQVSAQDIKAAAQALVKATPSSVGIGNRFAIPRLAQL